MRSAARSAEARFELENGIGDRLAHSFLGQAGGHDHAVSGIIEKARLDQDTRHVGAQ